MEKYEIEILYLNISVNVQIFYKKNRWYCSNIYTFQKMLARHI